ncbi:hypothetical protein XENOCAPTIV_029837 [Xenoophorus captivus]|uniref:Uncharacterized protein n=1 Tax=Xenoophorus captivus TaxID=1517983 RepID=A0ABV0R7D1_9TELE
MHRENMQTHHRMAPVRILKQQLLAGSSSANNCTTLQPPMLLCLASMCYVYFAVLRQDVFTGGGVTLLYNSPHVRESKKSLSAICRQAQQHKDFNFSLVVKAYRNNL